MRSLSLKDLAFLAFESTTPHDDFESYTVGDALNGLNGGTGWTGAYAEGVGYSGVQSNDDFSSYNVNDALDGLNGGTGWTGAYVNR